ncbi:MAG TPA: hypothetical protein VGM03_25130 [Phycisphaerae bacterium]|jgi:hypothetical protein
MVGVVANTFLADSNWAPIVGAVLFVVISIVSGIAKKLNEAKTSGPPRAPRAPAVRRPMPAPPPPVHPAPRRPVMTSANVPASRPSTAQRAPAVLVAQRPARTPQAPAKRIVAAPRVERPVEKKPSLPEPKPAEMLLAEIALPSSALSVAELRRAIILNELLQPPLALRMR